MKSLLMLALINLVRSQMCGIENPQGSSNCLGYSDSINKCCYANVSVANETRSVCVYVPLNHTFITPYIKNLDIGVEDQMINVELDCGEIRVSPDFYPCGENPSSFAECDINSKKGISSCCYLQTSDGAAYCLMNKGEFNLNETYFGINIQCKSQMVSYPHLLLLLLMSLIL